MPLRTAFDFARFGFDIGWAAWEYGAKVLLDPWLANVAPRTDKPYPVMTLPGFTGPEMSLAPLNRFLASLGFSPQSWGLGINRGPKDEAAFETIVKLLSPKLDGMAQATGRKPALVGQSLGGIYAREIARARPDLVDRVITLGSPAYLDPERLYELNRTLSAMMQLSTGRNAREHLSSPRRATLYPPPPGVPLVAIYSAWDGVAAKGATAIPDRDLTLDGPAPRENVEITGSHCGMAVNPVSLLAVADRLLEPVHAWRAFSAQTYLSGHASSLSPVFYPQRRSAQKSATA
jgi:pimeloyl-ACP methyl ester carboxylesterase